MVSIDILCQSMAVHGRAAAHAASRGCVSGANMPTVFPNDARLIQEAGGRLTRLYQPPDAPVALGQKKYTFFTY